MESYYLPLPQCYFCNSDSSLYCDEHSCYSCHACSYKQHGKCHIKFVRPTDRDKAEETLWQVVTYINNIQTAIDEGWLFSATHDYQRQLDTKFRKKCRFLRGQVRQSTRTRGGRKRDGGRLEQQARGLLAKIERSQLFVDYCVCRYKMDLAFGQRLQDEDVEYYWDDDDQEQLRDQERLGQNEISDITRDEYLEEEKREIAPTLQMFTNSCSHLQEHNILERVVDDAAISKDWDSIRQAIISKGAGYVMTLQELKDCLDSYDIRFDIHAKDLSLGFKSSIVQNMVRDFDGIRFPDLQRLTLNTEEGDDPYLKTFMMNCFPLKVKNFAILTSQNNYRGDIKDYVESLCQVAARVTEYISVCYFRIDQFEFSKLLAACANIRAVKFSSCMIESEGLELKEMNYNIDTIDFYCTGASCLSNWEENPSRFSAILEAFSKCSIKDSLHTLHVYRCGLEIDKIKEQMKLYDMTNTEVDTKFIISYT